MLHTSHYSRVSSLVRKRKRNLFAAVSRDVLCVRTCPKQMSLSRNVVRACVRSFDATRREGRRRWVVHECQIYARANLWRARSRNTKNTQTYTNYYIDEYVLYATRWIIHSLSSTTFACNSQNHGAAIETGACVRLRNIVVVVVDVVHPCEVYLPIYICIFICIYMCLYILPEYKYFYWYVSYDVMMPKMMMTTFYKGLFAEQRHSLLHVLILRGFACVCGHIHNNIHIRRLFMCVCLYSWKQLSLRTVVRTRRAMYVFAFCACPIDHVHCKWCAMV